MSDRPKAPPIPAPRPKAKNRARHAMAHVVTKGVTKVEVDGVPMTVEQSGNAKSLEFAAQVEEPNGRKVKIAGQVSYCDPRNPGCKGSPSQPCNGLHGGDGPTCPSCCLERSGGTCSKTPYPQADASSWIRNKYLNGEEEENYDPDPPPGLSARCGRSTATDARNSSSPGTGQAEEGANPQGEGKDGYKPQVWSVAEGKNELGKARKQKIRARIWELCQQVSA